MRSFILGQKTLCTKVPLEIFQNPLGIHHRRVAKNPTKATESAGNIHHILMALIFSNHLLSFENIHPTFLPVGLKFTPCHILESKRLCIRDGETEAQIGYKACSRSHSQMDRPRISSMACRPVLFLLIELPRHLYHLLS